ncbi:MAG: DUF1836 domain-containing protein [Candidatus Onthovivens sp.]|nr:DUF1836 domain-containing protein [Candidatus Onthovivens sp.]
MGKMLDDFENYIKELEKFSIPEYSELPDIPLYMEQVVGYIKENLSNIFKETDSVITPFMVNNYVKAKIIDSPTDKKYNKDHIGYLIAISMLKSVVSMRDLAVLIDLDRQQDPKDSKKSLYDFYKKMEDESFKNTIHKVKTRIDVFKKSSNQKKTKKSSQNVTDENERNSMAYIALRLYIESEVNKLIADKIMSQLSNEILPKRVLNETDIQKIDNKKTLMEAKKLSGRNKR